MHNPKLDPAEQDLLEAYESGELMSELSEERRKCLGQLAEEHSKKTRRINIRISSRDLAALQRRALEEELPYQSLVASVLHKYVSGGFKDVSAEDPKPRPRQGNDSGQR